MGGVPLGMPYGVGNCKKVGHQYQWVDETGGYGPPGGATPPSLKDIYGGEYVKHVFCSKCGDYRTVRLKVDKGLEKFLNMQKLKG